MELYLVTGARFHKGSDGKIYAGEMSYNYMLYERYLKKFDKVYIIGRLFDGADNIPKEHIITNAEVLPLPTFNGVVTFLKKKKLIRTSLEQYLKTDGIILTKGAGELARMTSEICKKNNIPYAVEVIGDPYDLFAPGVIKHPLRFFFRYLFTQIQKKVVYNASSVLYVTKSTLQKRYPANKNAFTTYASDVFINQAQDVAPKKLSHKKSYTLISIGALEQLYKAPNICIRVIAEMKKRGINLKLKWLGVGKYMEEMKSLSKKLGVDSQVDFVGSVSRKEVDEHLDKSDIFLLLSRTEGLPRAMIEAMARALPCIGTNVGGIPELLDKEFLVPVNDVETVCEKLRLLLENFDIYHKQSSLNLQTSKEYTPEVLDKKRNEFYESIKRMKKHQSLS